VRRMRRRDLLAVLNARVRTAPPGGWISGARRLDLGGAPGGAAPPAMRDLTRPWGWTGPPRRITSAAGEADAGRPRSGPGDLERPWRSAATASGADPAWGPSPCRGWGARGGRAATEARRTGGRRPSPRGLERWRRAGNGKGKSADRETAGGGSPGSTRRRLRMRRASKAALAAALAARSCGPPPRGRTGSKLGQQKTGRGELFEGSSAATSPRGPSRPGAHEPALPADRRDAPAAERSAAAIDVSGRSRVH
jgi:hypothetical protein